MLALIIVVLPLAYLSFGYYQQGQALINDPLAWLAIFLLALYFAHRLIFAPNEGFQDMDRLCPCTNELACPCMGIKDICRNEPLDRLYQEWGNGGIDNTYYPAPEELPYASIRSPQNTLVDQSICQDYAKQTCRDVRDFDRFLSCQEGQYSSCMNGRKRLIWDVESDPVVKPRD